ncbi:uncharacterized protein MONOS_9435 [Monocercomonoides exilis]|uniref:uncharacterized protein n=1 Tax=Monocercomonoides exilis TaxID=2049356 RepID=UPI00355A14DC|nr:hypothetical protein MONOS_9435 [Monocercomonoides exilis]|eukprot:MONOS_9435.1-p1 / transcript=MONOS_9435.1 / gene=MONOS_9435 / organism=Monocercomonoides_exilis_PA203 / gene_product=unspecified product / transcript_product=unspecified product / location=Mono_scaffold00390:4839-5787(-) / protein_length=264 / sequence_SO=supercontig / SO=protein_coding / is_pseudo=false
MLALLAENTILVMEKVVDDTCEPSLNSIMRAPPLPPELVSSLTEQLEKVESLTENVLSEADEANETHPPLVAVCWLNCSELMLVMVQLARERERAGEVAEERTQLVGVAVEVMWVMLEELRVRGDVREMRWKMLWLLRARLVIARADEADGSGEEDVDNDENEERDDVDCDNCECEVFVGVKVETRREREASLKGATHPRAYSTVAHGLCCVLPQASTSLPPFATILFWLMIGSHPLYTLLSAVPAFHTLFDGVVDPQFSNGD